MTGETDSANLGCGAAAPDVRATSRRGMTLLATAAGMTIFIGMLGLTADLSRMYIVKNELQTFVDAAALAAAYELDGTTQGISTARSIATSGPNGASSPNRWHFSTQLVSAPEVSFAQTLAGTYQADPATGSGYRFVRVTATAKLPLYFLRVFPGVPNSKSITSSATAGQGKETSIGEGVAPFSPDAHIADKAQEFGFTRGQMYDLKWAPPGQRKKAGGVCAGDVGFTPGGGSSDRGYIDIGQGNGNSALHDAIVNMDYHLAEPLSEGTAIDHVQGNKHVGPALEERFYQDTDTTAADYAHYSGNGRRVLVVPVNNAGSPALVVGFAQFFLRPGSWNKNNDPVCGEYIGPALEGAAKPGAGAPGNLYKVKLFR